MNSVEAEREEAVETARESMDRPGGVDPDAA